jgi:hypothetical protein
MRPQPPSHLVDFESTDDIDRFEVADDLREWIFDTFIAEDGELANPDHQHLADADIGVLWTNCANNRRMRSVIGQAEMMPPQAFGAWQKGRVVQQMSEWFGDLPDFVLTFYAPAAATMDDASFCALVEHELYHCAQALDQYGMPKFTKEGRPVFAMRGHDVEEFVGVVARYGATASGVSAMVEAAARRPAVALADIAGACGTCALKAA